MSTEKIATDNGTAKPAVPGFDDVVDRNGITLLMTPGDRGSCADKTRRSYDDEPGVPRFFSTRKLVVLLIAARHNILFGLLRVTGLLLPATRRFSAATLRRALCRGPVRRQISVRLTE